MKHPERYCEAVEGCEKLPCEVESLNADNLRTERIMLGLRLREGVEESEFNKSSLEKVVQNSWVTNNGKVRLTDLGAHYCNQVIVELL
jgi:oxygen-independent coproporphyrinogen-3 oxidase